MTEELKDCPFCGGEADNRHEYIVECRNNACTADCSIVGDSPEEAIKAWNTRTPKTLNDQIKPSLLNSSGGAPMYTGSLGSRPDNAGDNNE